jgi:hypothetical protein
MGADKTMFYYEPEKREVRVVSARMGPDKYQSGLAGTVQAISG